MDCTNIIVAFSRGEPIAPSANLVMINVGSDVINPMVNSGNGEKPMARQARQLRLAYLRRGWQILLCVGTVLLVATPALADTMNNYYTWCWNGFSASSPPPVSGNPLPSDLGGTASLSGYVFFDVNPSDGNMNKSDWAIPGRRSCSPRPAARRRLLPHTPAMTVPIRSPRCPRPATRSPWTFRIASRARTIWDCFRTRTGISFRPGRVRSLQTASPAFNWVPATLAHSTISPSWRIPSACCRCGQCSTRLRALYTRFPSPARLCCWQWRGWSSAG